MEPDYCDECDEEGWVWDDLSRAMGGTPWRYCHCEYGTLARAQDYKKHIEKKRKFKTCPTCSGAGKVKED